MDPPDFIALQLMSVSMLEANTIAWSPFFVAVASFLLLSQVLSVLKLLNYNKFLLQVFFAIYLIKVKATSYLLVDYVQLAVLKTRTGWSAQ